MESRIDKTEFLEKLQPLEKTIIEHRDPFLNEEELFKISYERLLDKLGKFAQRNSPSDWDRPRENWEYIFAEITYTFSETVDLFVNEEDMYDTELPPYRSYLHDHQAELLVQLSQMIEEYEHDNLVAIEERIEVKTIKKINKHFDKNNPKSIFPYCGLNRIISFDPEWNKIRVFSRKLWDDFVFNGLKQKDSVE